MFIVFLGGIHGLVFAMEELPESVVFVNDRFGSFGGIENWLRKIRP